MKKKQEDRTFWELELTSGKGHMKNENILYSYLEGCVCVCVCCFCLSKTFVKSALHTKDFGTLLFVSFILLLVEIKERDYITHMVD